MILNQFQATKDAGKMAGFNVLQIVNEPTAAAIAFCEQNKYYELIWSVSPQSYRNFPLKIEW